MKKANSGFTLIELVVVIVILGILAAVAVPKFFDLSGEAETAAAQGVAGSLASASSVNFAAKKVGSASAVTLNQADVCTAAILGPLMQGGIPTGFSLSGPGDCSGAAESVTCTVTKGTKTASAQVLCAR
jgi:MSHA pilin protein MshA